MQIKLVSYKRLKSPSSKVLVFELSKGHKQARVQTFAPVDELPQFAQWLTKIDFPVDTIVDETWFLKMLQTYQTNKLKHQRVRL